MVWYILHTKHENRKPEENNLRKIESSTLFMPPAPARPCNLNQMKQLSWNRIHLLWRVLRYQVLGKVSYILQGNRKSEMLEIRMSGESSQGIFCRRFIATRFEIFSRIHCAFHAYLRYRRLSSSAEKRGKVQVCIKSSGLETSRCCCISSNFRSPHFYSFFVLKQNN